MQYDDVVILRETETYATVASVNASLVKWRIENNQGLPTGSAFKKSKTEYKYITTAEGPKVVEELTTEEITEYELAGSLAITDYTAWQPEEIYLRSSLTLVTYEEKGGINSKPYTKTVTSRSIAWGLTQEGQQVAAEMLKLETGNGEITAKVVDSMKELISDGSETRSSLGKTPTPGRPTAQQMAAEEIQNKDNKNSTEDFFESSQVNPPSVVSNITTSGFSGSSFQRNVDSQIKLRSPSDINSTVPTFTELELIDNQQPGDRYVVIETGTVYEWNGTLWQAQGTYSEWLNTQAGQDEAVSSFYGIEDFPSVNTFADLFTIEGYDIGSQFLVKDSNLIYQWNGSTWENIGPIDPLIKGTLESSINLVDIENPKLGDKYLILQTDEIWHWDGSEWIPILNLQEWQDGQISDYRRLEITMPYAPDSYYSYAGSATIINGNAQQAAIKYGLMQNALISGHANGLNVTCAITSLPSEQFSLVYIDAEGISVAYKTDGTSFAFDSSGLVVSSDLLLAGVAGRIES